MKRLIIGYTAAAIIVSLSILKGKTSGCAEGVMPEARSCLAPVSTKHTYRVYSRIPSSKKTIELSYVIPLNRIRKGSALLASGICGHDGLRIVVEKDEYPAQTNYKIYYRTPAGRKNLVCDFSSYGNGQEGSALLRMDILGDDPELKDSGAVSAILKTSIALLRSDICANRKTNLVYFQNSISGTDNFKLLTIYLDLLDAPEVEHEMNPFSKRHHVDFSNPLSFIAMKLHFTHGAMNYYAAVMYPDKKLCVVINGLSIPCRIQSRAPRLVLAAERLNHGGINACGRWIRNGDEVLSFDHRTFRFTLMQTISHLTSAYGYGSYFIRGILKPDPSLVFIFEGRNALLQAA